MDTIFCVKCSVGNRALMKVLASNPFQAVQYIRHFYSSVYSVKVYRVVNSPYFYLYFYF